MIKKRSRVSVAELPASNEASVQLKRVQLTPGELDEAVARVSLAPLGSWVEAPNKMLVAVSGPSLSSVTVKAVPSPSTAVAGPVKTTARSAVTGLTLMTRLAALLTVLGSNSWPPAKTLMVTLPATLGVTRPKVRLRLSVAELPAANEASVQVKRLQLTPGELDEAVASVSVAPLGTWVEAPNKMLVAVSGPRLSTVTV